MANAMNVDTQFFIIKFLNAAHIIYYTPIRNTLHSALLARVRVMGAEYYGNRTHGVPSRLKDWLHLEFIARMYVAPQRAHPDTMTILIWI